MKTHLLLSSLCFVGLWLGSTAQAQLQRQVFFKDTFDVSAPSTDVDFESAQRQSGIVAPLSYARSPVDGDFINLGAPEAEGKLSLTSTIYVSPNHNFIEGGDFIIEFDVDPGVNDTGVPLSGDWCGVVFGSTTQNPFIYSSDGLGILFRNDGRIEVWERDTEGVVYSGAGDYPGGIPTDQPFHVRIEANAPDFKGSPATVKMFVNDTQVRIDNSSLEHIKADGFKGNYITFQSQGWGGVWTALFDNLTVSIIPCISVAPNNSDLLVGKTSDPITVTIPAQMNATQPAQVTVSTQNKGVAVPGGANADGVLTLNFAAGGPTSQTFTISAVGVGSTTVVVAGPAGVCVNNSVQVNVGSGVGLPEVLFSDTFETSTGSYDVNFEINMGRQAGGSVGVLAYTEPAATASGGASDDWTQVGAIEAPGALLLAAGGGWSSVTPNASFTQGGTFSIEFDLDPGINDYDNFSTDWAAIVFGATARNAFVNASDGFGILFRNQGDIQVFDGTAAVYGGNGGIEGGLPRGPFHVKIDVTTFGFHGTPATVALFVDGQPVDINSGPDLTYTKAAGFNGNYITLLGYGATAGSPWYHVFDNLKVSALACLNVAPSAIFTVAGDSDKTVTVTIPRALNATQAATVDLVSIDPNVAVPTGAVNGRLAITFAAGAAATKTIGVTAVGAGVTQFVLTSELGVCTGDAVTVNVSPAAPPVLCDNFSGNDLNPLLRVNPAPFEAGVADGIAAVSGGQFVFDLTALENYWGGMSVATEKTFSASAGSPLTVEIDRVSHTGVSQGSATRSALWITDQARTRYVLFSDNQGEGGWEYNRRSGLPGDNAIGNGTDIAEFDGATFDDGGRHHMKMVANGTTVRLFLDGIAGPEVPFPVTSGIVVEFGAYTRAVGDSVSAAFDNLCIYSSVEPAMPCIVISPAAISGVKGQTLPVTVTVSKLLTAAKALAVTLSSDHPEVTELVGGTAGSVTLNFASGGPVSQTVDVTLLDRGFATLTVTNPDGACALRTVSVASRSTFLANPSFEENYPETWPHYGTASGWINSGGTGINEAAGPFHDNGVIPDRARIALMQGTARLSQMIGNLVPGKTYWFQFRYNTRNCCGGLSWLSAQFNGVDLQVYEDLLPVGGANPYNYAHVVFTADATEGEVAIAASVPAGGDATALVDAVSIVQRDPGQIVLMNPSFEASGNPPWPGYIQPARITGWDCTGNYGVNNALAGPFADNGVNPDQDSVLLLQGQGSSASQQVTGLTAGQNYTLSFAANARGGNAPRLKVLFADQVIFEEDIAPVGGRNPYLAKSVVFTASAAAGVLRFEESAAGDNTVLIDDVKLVAGGTVEEKVSLKVAHTAENAVRVSWPANVTGYTLQFTTALPGGWQNSTAPVISQGNESVVLVQPTGQAQFFRLRK